MELRLINIKNKKVKHFLKIHDYFQIYFEDDYILTIFNKFDSKNITFIDSDNNIVDDIVVLEVIENLEFIKIIFSNNSYIEVSLKDEAYLGPEAMTFGQKGKIPLIWT